MSGSSFSPLNRPAAVEPEPAAADAAQLRLRPLTPISQLWLRSELLSPHVGIIIKEMGIIEHLDPWDCLGANQAEIRGSRRWSRPGSC